MRRFLKAIAIIATGALASALLYPLTHDTPCRPRRVPEIVGIAAGCVVVDAALWWLFCDWPPIEKAVGASFVAHALVGLGVALNRVAMDWRHTQ